MVQITEGITPAEFIAAVNNNNTEIEYSAATSTFDAISESSNVSVINDNFQAIKALTPNAPTTRTFAAGMSGLNFISYLNQNYTGYYRKNAGAYLNLGFGAHIGFSMVTFSGDGLVPVANINDFNPSAIDIESWLDTFVLAGMKYATFIVKSHDGFCLYPTTYFETGHDPYSIAETTWYANNGSPDLFKIFTDGCRERGLSPCFYYSILDGAHESWHGDDVADAPAYIAMIESQLTELLTNYGDITAIWFDGWEWGSCPKYVNIPFATISDHVKSIQPNCLVLNNDQLHPCQYSEVEIYEASDTGLSGHVPAGNHVTCEDAEPMRYDCSWIYVSTSDQTANALMTKEQINAAVAQANSRNANYNLGVYPDTTGNLTAAQTAVLESLQV
jgi:alpha-L-fucosidase